jgi:serine phosphatase RsbU (regulator of sigma subunit)
MGEILNAKSLSYRIFLLIFLFIASISFYFSYKSYKDFIVKGEEDALKRLEAIAKTTSMFIDGDAHEILSKKYLLKDDIRTNKQDATYWQLHTLLERVEKENNLGTDVYTIVMSDDKKNFQFIVTSGENPYYRHSYTIFPENLTKNFDKGGILGQYKSENGTWLSAFAPLRNSLGEVVAVVYIDQKFDDFIRMASSQLLEDIAMSFALIIILSILIIYFLRKVVQNEEKQKDEIIKAAKIIELKNKSIEDSINYAKRIQTALVPNEKSFQKIFPDSYIFFRGRDKVSGDFPWLYKPENSPIVYFAAVDCTGHGVPGALLSIIGYFLLNNIVKAERATNPAQILEMLHWDVVEVLNQQEDESNNDGMDVALVKIDQKLKQIEYSGAKRPLLFWHEGELQEIKGDKLPVGGTQYQRFNKEIVFTNHTLQFTSGDKVHIFSDGYQDQFGGDKGDKRFTTKQMKLLFAENQHLPMKDMKKVLDDSFEKWKGQFPQMDDVLVAGIQF